MNRLAATRSIPVSSWSYSSLPLLSPKSARAGRSPRPNSPRTMPRQTLRLRAATLELLMRRIAAAWLEGQREVYRNHP